MPRSEYHSILYSCHGAVTIIRKQSYLENFTKLIYTKLILSILNNFKMSFIAASSHLTSSLYLLLIGVITILYTYRNSTVKLNDIIIIM